MREIAAPWGLLTRYIARGPENPTGMSNFFSGLPAGPRTEGVGAAGADYNQPPRRSPDRPMSSADQVTLWIAQLKDGEHVAVQRLLEVYFRRLVGLARARLQGVPALAGYDEDVALSAFKSLCLGAEQGRFVQLDDRTDLWRLLAVITVRKAIDLQR